MNIGTKEVIEAFALVSGWVAAFTTVRVKAAHTERQLTALKDEHRRSLDRLESTLKREDEVLHERIETKKTMFEEFKEGIRDEVARIKSENGRFLRADIAEQKFVSKAELKLMLENLNLQYQRLEEKMDDIISAVRGKA